MKKVRTLMLSFCIISFQAIQPVEVLWQFFFLVMDFTQRNACFLVFISNDRWFYWVSEESRRGRNWWWTVFMVQLKIKQVEKNGFLLLACFSIAWLIILMVQIYVTVPCSINTCLMEETYDEIPIITHPKFMSFLLFLFKKRSYVLEKPLKEDLSYFIVL